MSPQFLEVQEVNSTDGKPMGRVLIGLQHVVYVTEPTQGRPTRFAEIVSAGPGGFCKTYTDANYDEVVERLAPDAERVVVPPPRVHVADLDPDTLVGISLCDDGSEGWVVLQCVEEVDPSNMVVIKPVGDAHGQIVYTDIKDAAEVLRTGKVWKHDMGEGEPDVADEADTTTAGQEDMGHV